MAGKAGAAVEEYGILGKLLGKVGLHNAHTHMHQPLDPSLHVFHKAGVGEVQGCHLPGVHVALARRENSGIAVGTLHQPALVRHGPELVRNPTLRVDGLDIREHPQRQPDAPLPEPADHALRIREPLFVKAQQFRGTAGQEAVLEIGLPGIDVDHVHAYAEALHLLHDFFQLGTAHIAHPGHPEAEGPLGNHGAAAGQGGVVPDQILIIPVAEHIVVQIRIFRLHGVGNAGGSAHVKMGPGEGVHQHAVAGAAHKVGHALVGNV